VYHQQPYQQIMSTYCLNLNLLTYPQPKPRL